MREEFREARRFYEKAIKISPDHPKVLLAVSRANHELENYGTARELHMRLSSLNPELADEYRYLGMRGEEGARAAEAAGVANTVLWIEEGK